MIEKILRVIFCTAVVIALLAGMVKCVAFTNHAIEEEQRKSDAKYGGDLITMEEPLSLKSGAVIGTGVELREVILKNNNWHANKMVNLLEKDGNSCQDITSLHVSIDPHRFVNREIYTITCDGISYRIRFVETLFFGADQGWTVRRTE